MALYAGTLIDKQYNVIIRCICVTISRTCRRNVTSNTKAMTVEELLRQRSIYKALVTKSSCTLTRRISEGEVNRIQKHGIRMKAWFHSFDEASESYIETLTNEIDITAAESYYDAIYDDYMDQLDSLNYAMDSFTMQASAVVQRTDSNTTLSTISPIINLPKMVREQETKSPIQPVQSVVQNNETVLINTHNCTCQPLPSQQVQEDMSIELVHLSTCVHDHTAPNCDKSLLDLHIDVKAQSEVSISTITMEQQPDLFNCEPPVTIQCSPVSLDPHIDQTDIYVPSPTPCAHYSPTAHTTMHLDRNVPSRRLLHPAYQVLNLCSVSSDTTLLIPTTPVYIRELVQNKSVKKVCISHDLIGFVKINKSPQIHIK